MRQLSRCRHEAATADLRGSIRARVVLAAVLAVAAVALLPAPGARAQMFKQCPPVDADGGCQFLITVTAAGPSVAQDPTQSPYEVEDDSLIGVQNNSPNAISALPLASPGAGLFGFEEDGICDPGKGPVAPGCQPPPGSPPGTTCEGRSVACSFRPPAGEPPNTVEAGSNGALAWPSGDKQNGYEGPTSWFTAIANAGSSGTVNFSPPIQPGASTYFSLEAPPNASAIQVGTPTTTPPAGRPTKPGRRTKPPSLFGKNGIVQGLPSNKLCLSKRHFTIHVRRYPGITYASALVFVNRKSVKVTKEASGRFSSFIDLRGLSAGTFPVKITVITTTGSIISGTRTYKTCHRKVGFRGPGRL